MVIGNRYGSSSGMRSLNSSTFIVEESVL